MKVILDLHAVPGSQNGNHHSGSRDGFIEWDESRILETVSVIEFLAQRLYISLLKIYYKNPHTIFSVPESGPPVLNSITLVKLLGTTDLS